MRAQHRHCTTPCVYTQACQRRACTHSALLRRATWLFVAPRSWGPPPTSVVVHVSRRASNSKAPAPIATPYPPPPPRVSKHGGRVGGALYPTRRAGSQFWRLAQNKSSVLRGVRRVVVIPFCMALFGECSPQRVLVSRPNTQLNGALGGLGTERSPPPASQWSIIRSEGEGWGVVARANNKDAVQGGCRPRTAHAASFKYPGLYPVLHSMAPGLGT